MSTYGIKGGAMSRVMATVSANPGQRLTVDQIAEHTGDGVGEVRSALDALVGIGLLDCHRAPAERAFESAARRLTPAGGMAKVGGR